ncbi:MAG: nucleotidyltransferase domain-containing protein [Oscillospiraceae bacterium]|jgi:predicted nucleotidyltransferase|nr:nucleotidyltransferase domain-containing protein [Oscillospiraceae bacterium]
MHDVISEKLNKIEQAENVTILYAVESGSRAWGFASPDSDYDVRFFYVRPRAYYLRLDRTRDVLEYPINDDLDINGWDLDKTLKLLHASNPALFEWSNSPIVYKTTDEFKRLLPLISSYFVARSGLWHYLSMAEGNYREYLKGETVKAKKYFYVIRPLLACRWILERRTPPPMLFTELVETQLEPQLKPLVADLLQLKMSVTESGETPKIVPLNSFIEQSLRIIREQIEALPKEQPSDWEPLNDLFLSILENGK